MTNRLFIALETPGEILNDIIAKRDSVYGTENRVKWEPEEKLHITLKFLGDTDVNLNSAICSCIKEIVKRHKPVELEFTKFGMFYRNANPSILWLGLKKNVALKELFLELDSEISSFGFAKENREFKPHLTILRIKGNEDIGKLNKIVAEPEVSLKFEARKIILFKSSLLKSGSVYEEIENFILK